MPLPQLSSVHVDRLLTDMSVGFLQDAGNFVADKVFPRVPSDKQSGKYAQYTLADFYRDEMQPRGSGAESAGGGFRTTTNNVYFADVWASHVDVDDFVVAGADQPFQPAEDATRLLVQRELIKREVIFGAKFFASSIWTGGTSADPTAASLSGAWDDPSSTPIEDIHDQVNSIRKKTGYKPNTLVLNNLGWFALKNHPDIVDRVKYTSAEPISEEIVARLFGLDQILVSYATNNTAQEGLSASMSDVLGNSALLVYSAPSPGLFQPSGGYTFVWTGYPGAVDGRLIRRFRIEPRRAERIEIEATWDMKLVAADLGCFITSVAS